MSNQPAKPAEKPTNKVEVKNETPKEEKVAVSNQPAKPAEKPKTAADGIDWFSVETGETVYTKRSAAIKAFINSSDYSPNAHVGQNRGWRLGPIWKKKLEKALEDDDLSALVDKFSDDDGVVTNYPGLIIALWNREVKLNRRKTRRGGQQSPFADKYNELINKK